MERMNDYKKEFDLACNKIVKLEEENKKLKLIQETNEKQLKNDIKERDELREENKKLKEDLRIAQGLVEKYEEIELKMGEENKKLKEEVERCGKIRKMFSDGTW